MSYGLLGEINALRERAEKAEARVSELEAALQEARRKALEEAAGVLDRRAAREDKFAEAHKANQKHFKAREAAHVARLAAQDAFAIRALASEAPDGR